MSRALLGLLLAAASACGTAPPPPRAAAPDLRTVDTAVTAATSPSALAAAAQPGYLGLQTGPDLVIADVAAGSPAERAGLRPGDRILELAGEAIGDADDLGERIRSASPGDEVVLAVERNGGRVDVKATLGAVSGPKPAGGRRALLGVQTDAAEGGGQRLARLSPGMPAEQAGLKVGDVIVELDGIPLGTDRLADRLADRRPGETVTLDVRRDGRTEEIRVTLAAEPESGDGYFGGAPPWKKEVYRLAVVGVEFPDVKRNAKIEPKHWEESLFSTGTWKDRESVTGQAVHGSLNDYYREQSCGKLRVEGRFVGWVEAKKNRPEYAGATGSAKTALLTEVLGALEEREGKDVLKDFDGLFFVYAGTRVQTNRGGLYWPHRGSVSHKGQRRAYFIVPEGGSRMTSISVIAHEFGHMLGLPDLYARPENPGSEGLGAWCAMSNEQGGGRPQHFGAWCKERLGWLVPAVIDPRVKQRLVLSPVEGSGKECFKVLVRPDGSEYFLLENRRRTGFDHDLPAEGLLIWRVVRGRVMLEESHGVEGPSGPRVHLGFVPYPSDSNDAFTPHTTPSSRSQMGGGFPVHLTQIRRLPDGRISFTVGAEFD